MNWVSSITEVIDNLEYDGKKEILDWLESDILCSDETRSELLNVISILEGQLYDRDNEIAELRCEIAKLTEDDWK